MKLNPRWTLLFLVLAFFAIIWFLGGFRENFQQAAKFGTPVCPAGSSPTEDGTSCKGPCPAQTNPWGDTCIPTYATTNNATIFAPIVKPLSCLTGTLTGNYCIICEPGTTIKSNGSVYTCVSNTIGKTESPPKPTSSTLPKKPCQPSYKSIPGGSIEYKCFD